MPPGKRLHISPLNPQLLPFILPGPLLEKASNISFHTIQTFPDKNYGYLELPDTEADKLRKKLNGSTLKGSKMRVEEARPKKQAKPAQAEAEETANLERPGTTGRKKRAKEEGVIPGHELQDRKVKRGWTEPTDGTKPSKHRKDKAEKRATSKPSSITGEAECLFRTDLPPNAAASGDQKDGKVKKRKRETSTHTTVVHEFKNTTKHPNFLRDETLTKGKHSATEFLEGKGWVDEDGNVVEQAPKRRRSKSKPQESTETVAEEPKKLGSRRSSRLEAPSVQVTKPKKGKAPPVIADDETSSSGTSESTNDSDSSQSQKSAPPSKQTKWSQNTGKKQGLGISNDDGVETDRVERLSITRSSATPPPPPPSDNPPPTSAPPLTNDIHPLEALFKRPQPKTAAASSHNPNKPNLEVSTSFPFSDPSLDIDSGETQTLVVPQTPFTQQDFRQRRQRSAAPTPDTAAPGQTFGNIWEGTSDISDASDASDNDMEDAGAALSGSKDISASATPDIKEEKPESEFAKWFWEHRGENNRAWKRRRREAAKEKRQRENRERRGGV